MVIWFVFWSVLVRFLCCKLFFLLFLIVWVWCILWVVFIWCLIEFMNVFNRDCLVDVFLCNMKSSFFLGFVGNLLVILMLFGNVFVKLEECIFCFFIILVWFWSLFYVVKGFGKFGVWLFFCGKFYKFFLWWVFWYCRVLLILW